MISGTAPPWVGCVEFIAEDGGEPSLRLRAFGRIWRNANHAER